MDWYYYIAVTAILSQAVFLVQMLRNYRYAMKKYKKPRLWYRPSTVLIIPCKGLDSAFQKNISSFFNQDYNNYLLWFVVAEKQDPAYGELCKLKDLLIQKTKAQDVQIFIAGQSQSCSQKIHNLLYCYNRIEEDIEILAFADSDICVRSDWLSHIVYPLHQPKNGAASGYRWFIPKTNNLASLALSALNAKVAQMLGNTHFNQVWGGSMAIQVDVFRRLELDKIWQKTLSDDYSLSRTVKKAGLKVVFVPACLVASYETTTWSKLFEFVRRQFLITRIYAPGVWWFGLVSSLYSILCLWATAAVAFYAVKIGDKNLLLYAFVPVFFFVSQLLRTMLRQQMILKMLEEDLSKLKLARIADIFFFWLWSLLMLVLIISSAFGREICWRGIRYKILNATEAVVVRSKK